MTTTPESKDFVLSDEGLRNATRTRILIAKIIEHYYGEDYAIDFLDETTDESLVKDFPELSKPDPDPKVVSDMLGLVLPTTPRPGTGFSPNNNPYFTPVKEIPNRIADIQEFMAEAQSRGKSLVDAGQAITAALAAAMAIGQKSSNIFNSGKGKDSGSGGPTNNDFGKLYERLDPGSTGNFINFEPDKLSFDWNLGLDTTMNGQAPFWTPTRYSSCFVGAIRQLGIPSNDIESAKNFQDTLVPYLRNKINSDKRYNAQLAEFFTWENYQDYMNRFIKACSVYHFFANIYDYTNMDIRVNNNAGIRYMRDNLVQTAQLQRLASLKQLLDSMPFPQTLQNSIAQYYGWYSTSESPMAQIYCNVPEVFKTTGTVAAPSESTYLDSFITDIIETQISQLNYYDKEVDLRKPYYKLMSILNNVIPGYALSNIGSSYITDVYDENHMTMWLNGPTIIRMVSGAPSTGFGTKDLMHPYLHNALDQVSNVSYFSKTNEPHGYLEGYHSTVSGNPIVHITNGYQTPIGLTTIDNFANDHTTVTSNIFAFVDRNTSTLRAAGPTFASRGMVLLPSQGEGNYLSATPLPILYGQDVSTLGSVKVTFDVYRPSDCVEITNANLQQFVFNRNAVLQKWIDIQDYSGGLSNSSSGGKRSKFSKGRSKDKAEDKTETTS
uniref:Uncharacterized protein n=1 Tax=viral metagenome TaxID=1070528 RepID=A0A2V0RC95_9ZZZZ